jgi:DNA-binding XRE family transcriptional regulator
MTSANSAHSKSSPPTRSSTSPPIRRFGSPYALINPETRAENVLAIVEQVVHAPIPADYTEIDDVLRRSEQDSRRAAALARARKRIATRISEANPSPTLSSLRLSAGLSQSKIAELLGNSQSSYSMIESGRRKDILLSTFNSLARILSVSRDDLAAALDNTQKGKS